MFRFSLEWANAVVRVESTSLNVFRTKCSTENVYDGARFINIRFEGRVTKFVKAIVTRQPRRVT